MICLIVKHDRVFRRRDVFFCDTKRYFKLSQALGVPVTSLRASRQSELSPCPPQAFFAFYFFESEKKVLIFPIIALTHSLSLSINFAFLLLFVVHLGVWQK